MSFGERNVATCIHNICQWYLGSSVCVCGGGARGRGNRGGEERKQTIYNWKL